MKKLEKSCKKIVKKTNKMAKKNPVAAVAVGSATGALALTGVGFLAEKAVGKIVCAISSKKKDEE